MLQTVKDIYSAFGRGDIDAIMVQVADNVLWESEGPAKMAFTGIRHGKSEVMGFFAGLAREHADPQLAMTDFVSSGDSVAAFGRYQCTLRRTGVRVDSPVAHLFQFAGGKISHYVGMINTAAFVNHS